jgi:hypothetical protein
MKFDPTNASLGLFFKDEGGEETRATVYAEILPSSLIAVVPAALAAGDYRLVLRTLSKGGDRLEGTGAEAVRISKPL